MKALLKTMDFKREDLIVEIPKKYRESLEARFNYENKIWTYYENKKFNLRIDWKIRIGCPLCKNSYCSSCPFGRFGAFFPKRVLGCMVWIKKILPVRHFEIGEDLIHWRAENDEIVKNELKILKEKAKKLIKWV